MHTNQKKIRGERGKKNYTKGYFFGLHLFSKSKDKLLNLLAIHLQKKSDLLVLFTPNPEQIVQAQKDRDFALVLGSADLLLPDGIGLVIGQKIHAFLTKSTPVTERITGIDVAAGLLHRHRTSQETFLIVGGREYHGRFFDGWHVRRYSKQAEKKYAHQRVIWWTPAFADVTCASSLEHTELAEVISQLQPTIIFVALGAPFQEFWTKEHSVELQQAGVKIVLVVGGAFDVLLGKLNRAPKIMRFLGLEWLYRLYQEPSRWRRQVSLLQFVKMVFGQIFDGRSL